MKNYLSNLKINIRNVLAVLVLVGIFFLLMILMFHPVPLSNQKTVERAIDQLLVVGFAVVIAYYFVSSKTDADRVKHQQTKELLEVVPASDLIAKVKDTALLFQEREQWFKKLVEQYPEYSQYTVDTLP